MEQNLADSLHTRQLLEQARNGNAEAFDRLFAHHRPFLRQVVTWRMDREMRQRVDPSDIVQEAHMEAARRLVRYMDAPPMPFKLWLRQITYDRILMARRKHLEAGKRAVGREQTLPDETSFQLARKLIAADPSPSQVVMRSELAAHVQEALSRLSEADREVLVMRHLEGLSNSEIAQSLGMEPAAASKRYGRALLRLRAMLSEAGEQKT